MLYEREFMNDIQIAYGRLSAADIKYHALLKTTGYSAFSSWTEGHTKENQEITVIADQILFTACKEFVQWFNENIPSNLDDSNV